MPLGKYYCDYCDKQFQDTPAARKRHLQGLHHQRARALWYDSFKEPHGAPLFHPDGSLAKGVCHHFVRTGACKYGDACKYFHPKQNMPSPATSLTDYCGTWHGCYASVKNPRMSPGMNYAEAVPFPNSLVTHLQGEGSSGTVNIINQAGISWGNLPPSLRPPPEGGHPPLPFVDWG